MLWEDLPCFLTRGPADPTPADTDTDGTGRLSILPEPVRPARGNFVTERPHIYQNSFSDICRPVSLQLRFRNSKIGRVLIIVPISAYLFMNYKPSPIKIFHTQYLPNWNSLINQKEIAIFRNHQNFTYL